MGALVRERQSGRGRQARHLSVPEAKCPGCGMVDGWTGGGPKRAAGNKEGPGLQLGVYSHGRLSLTGSDRPRRLYIESVSDLDPGKLRS